MYSSRFWLYLSLALVASFSFSNAMFGFDKRQVNAVLSDISAGPSAIIPAPAATSTLPVINADTTTSSSGTISDTSIKTPTLAAPPISNQTTTTTTTSSTSTSSSSSISSTKTSSSTPITTTSTSGSSTTMTTQSVMTIPRATVVTTVTLNGLTYTSSSISYSTSTASGVAAASTDSSTSGPSGMTSQTRSTIIGVTVGIGGAIILAGLAFVAWRLWGKRAPRMDEDEILMAGSNAHGEKLTGSSGSGSQFKSTLDQYHAHSGTNF